MGFFERNMHINKVDKKFFDKKKTILTSISAVVFLVILGMTFYFLKVSPAEMIHNLNTAYKQNKLILLLIFIILLQPVVKGCYAIACIRPRMKKCGIYVSWFEYIFLYIKVFVINAITPFATGSEPYNIYWMRSRGADLKTANLVSVITGIGNTISDTFITLPSFIVISMHYNELARTTDGLIVYWFIVGGLLVTLFVLFSYLCIGLSKRLHYWVSLAFNKCLKVLKRPHLTKEETYQKYIIDAEFRKMVLEGLKEKRFIIYVIIWFAINSIFLYITIPLAFMVNTGDFSYFNNANNFLMFFNIANLAITANNFIPLPGSEGTVQMCISFLTKSLGGTSIFTIEFVNSSIMLWRTLTTYLPLMLFVVLIIIYYTVKVILIKRQDKQKELNNESIKFINHKFSVLIPMYNCEKYIKRAIESVLNQNYDAYEIIVLDDGSKDQSAKIVQELMKKHKNITYKHKKNEGLAQAREDLIKLAKHTYLVFLDADDWMSENTLASYNEVINKELDVDVIFSGAFVAKQKKERIYTKPYYLLSTWYKNDLAFFLKNNTPYFWSNCINKKLLTRHQIHVNGKNRYFEDAGTMLEIISKSENIQIMNKLTTYYFVNADSLSRSKLNESKVNDSVSQLRYLISNLDENTLNNKMYKQQLMFYFAIVFWQIKYQSTLSKQEQKNYLTQLVSLEQQIKSWSIPHKWFKKYVCIYYWMCTISIRKQLRSELKL